MWKNNKHNLSDHWENPEAPFLTEDEIKAAKTPEELQALFDRPIRRTKSDSNLVIELI